MRGGLVGSSILGVMQCFFAMRGCVSLDCKKLNEWFGLLQIVDE
jgi:hypothetical protein